MLISMALDDFESNYSDLDIIRIKGGYIVKTNPLSNKFYRVKNPQEVKRLMYEAKNLDRPTFYMGFEGYEKEIHEFERHITQILYNRSKR